MAKMVVKSAFGGFFIGISVASILFNAVLSSAPIFIASGIVGILGGCGLIASALDAERGFDENDGQRQNK